MSNERKLLIEEFVPAGRFLFNSFTRDRAELAGRFTEFTPAFLTAYSNKIEEVKALEKTIVLTKAQKQATIDLYATASTLNNDLNFVSFYFKRAQLDTKMITKLKADLAKRNIEGACEKITGVEQYIVANHLALESKGMAVGFPAALLVTKATLETKNELQNTVRNQKKTLYDNNTLVYDALYEYIITVANAGKIMYKGKTKVVEYTLSKIIARLRSSNDGGDDIIPPSEG
jgi:hypothetical protein